MWSSHSWGAAVLALLAYLFISLTAIADATQLDQIIPSDHNHPIIDASFTEGGDIPATNSPIVGSVTNQWLNGQNRALDDVEEVARQEMRRAPAGVSTLANNAPQNMNIAPGETQNWLFPQEAIEGPHGEEGVGFPSDASVTGNMSDDGPFRLELKRQSSIPVWITINTCLQPSTNTSAGNIPPQLELYYSTSQSDETPGPSSNAIQVDVTGGFGIIEIDASDDVYVGVTAPNGTQLSGSWNYEIAASIDAPFHFWSNSTDLLFVDGDSHAALLITPDLTDASSNSTIYQDWLALAPPYGIFAHNQNDTAILGVSRSYCGLRHNAQIMANIPSVDNNNAATMTNRGIGAAPKEQFYIGALEASSSYWGVLAMTGNSTDSGLNVIGGGGRVWTNMTFRTKTLDNCALLYNLSFCSEVAYAVPSNPNNYSGSTGLAALGAAYDDYAMGMYELFNYSLQQIPCNTTPSAQYSLARDCDDCARAYKQWLCAVSIPRCEDWDNEASYLAPRNMAQDWPNGTAPYWLSNPSINQSVSTDIQINSSRNAQVIDQTIMPGPYKEVLPCIDLCYDIVQSCPAIFMFMCPSGIYKNMSYGVRSSDPGTISCSYLGAAYYLSDASSIRSWNAGHVSMTGSVVLATALALLFL